MKVAVITCLILMEIAWVSIMALLWFFRLPWLLRHESLRDSFRKHVWPDITNPMDDEVII
jgi:hypothetical protein